MGLGSQQRGGVLREEAVSLPGSLRAVGGFQLVFLGDNVFTCPSSPVCRKAENTPSRQVTFPPRLTHPQAGFTSGDCGADFVQWGRGSGPRKVRAQPSAWLRQEDTQAVRANLNPAPGALGAETEEMESLPLVKRSFPARGDCTHWAQPWSHGLANRHLRGKKKHNVVTSVCLRPHHGGSLLLQETDFLSHFDTPSSQKSTRFHILTLGYILKWQSSQGTLKTTKSQKKEATLGSIKHHGGCCPLGLGGSAKLSFSCSAQVMIRS